MFESIRDKIFTVQHDISASIKNLTVGDNRPVRYERKEKQFCDPNAGADLLFRYQSQWNELHELAEENVQKAEQVDQLIGGLKVQCEKQMESLGQLNSQLALLPVLNQSVQALMEQIASMGNRFEEVEICLIKLEDLIEVQELQEKQLDNRFQLALHKERKLGELEQLKVNLAMEHAKKVQEFETKHQSRLKERQEAFEEAFEEEMQHYKTHGHIERIPSSASEASVPLEEIQLEGDSSALDEFLAEEATEDILRQYAIAEAIADED